MGHRIVSLALVCAAALPTVAPAQSAVLSIGIETVKPGKGYAHDQLEAAWASAMYAAKPPYGFLAMRTVTGLNQVWYASVYDSWAEYQKSMASTPALDAIDARFRPQESELLSDTRTIILTRIDSLGYGTMPDIATMRGMSVTRVTLRPGSYNVWAEGRMAAKRAHQAANLTDHFSIWALADGAPGGTYYLFVARKSFAELDEAPKIHGQAYQAALGDDGRKKLDAAQEVVANSQSDLLAFVPSQSVLSDEMAKADPAYWAHKPAAKTVKKP